MTRTTNFNSRADDPPSIPFLPRKMFLSRGGRVGRAFGICSKFGKRAKEDLFKECYFIFEGKEASSVPSFLEVGV